MFFGKLFFILAALGTMDEKGWVPVERPKKEAAPPASGSEEAEWPVFVRQFGDDRVLIQFPNEPTYVYPQVEQGDLETVHIETATPDIAHRLFVELPKVDFETFIEQKKAQILAKEGALLLSIDAKGPQTVDCFYKEGDYWVRERIIKSAERIYILQTVSQSLDEAKHLQFIHSFDLEIRGDDKVFHREIQSKN